MVSRVIRLLKVFFVLLFLVSLLVYCGSFLNFGNFFFFNSGNLRESFGTAGCVGVRFVFLFIVLVFLKRCFLRFLDGVSMCVFWGK